ncbi:MAG: hypothetical protein JRM87_03950, partial [Nitrososphaerota archaeon]|nr:hypothetical protein [Nitrososphaerota archaeon]
SLRKKLKNINAGSGEGIHIINMMSGDLNIAFSEIESALRKGEMVVVDSVDAMFYAIKDDKDIRPFLQLIYSSVKNKKGSLILISEGLNPVANHIRFVCDAIISVERPEVLGWRARSAIIKKDRDGVISTPLNYFTFDGGFRILKPLHLTAEPEITRFSGLKLSPEAEASNTGIGGFNNMLELDLDVADMRSRLYRELLAAHFLEKGYTVNFMAGPEEDESEIVNSVNQILGGKTSKLNVFLPEPEALGYSARAYFNDLIQKYPSDHSVNLINLLCDEDFAVNAPKEYEMFTRLIARENNNKKRLAILVGYKNQEAARIQSKYANAFRRMTVTDGFLFWRSIRPIGPLYMVQMRPEAGTMEFIRMI